MTNNISIRAASRDDAVELAALLTRLGSSIDPGVAIARLGRLEATGLDQVLVAEAQDRVVGLVCMHITPALLQHEGPSARITALVVDQGWAQSAAGENLVLAVEELAHAAGCTTVEAAGHNDSPDARAFYEAIGYTRSHTLFRKSF
jgi:N-acetylglutamate synthase-like GNAT family acetyltransferase